jgi:hypothetical protein
MLTSWSGFSLSRCSSWALMTLATVSSMGVPKKMMRSLKSREYRSKTRSPRVLCSTTVGTKSSRIGSLPFPQFMGSGATQIN